jgi:TonB family protein
MGAGITLVVVVGLGYGAQRFEPARKLMQQVVQMTVMPEPPKPDDLPPPRTEPPPPPPKRAPPKSSPKTAAAAPKPTNPNQQTAEPVVGLDEGSFGAGEGASFQVGNTQLGEPDTVARAPVVAPPALKQGPPSKLVPAGVPARAERCQYSTRARRLGLEGLIIIEVDIDDEGRVTNADLRKRLDDELDQECLEGVRTALFQPATLGGQAVASTRFLRLRFELER